MRACEGCRRRKIKCDAATTNAWPCAACIRLKLNCVPPTVNYDKDFDGSQTFELEPKPLEYASDEPAQHDHQRHAVMSYGMPHQMAPSLPSPGSGMYQTSPYADHPSQEAVHYQSMSQAQVVPQNISYAPQRAYSHSSAPPPVMTMTPPESEPNWRNDSVSNLSDALGELKIDHTAIGNVTCQLCLKERTANQHSALHYEYEESTRRDSGTRRVRGPAASVSQHGPDSANPPRNDALGRKGTTLFRILLHQRSPLLSHHQQVILLPTMAECARFHLTPDA